MYLYAIMIELGKYNWLPVLRKNENETVLADDEKNEYKLSKLENTDDLVEGKKVKVFAYKNENNIVVTREEPYVKLNEFAYLRVNEVTEVGAFLDWGLPKDLFVPFREQSSKMRENKWYVVYMFLDKKTNRLVASSRLNDFIEREKITVKKGDQVDLLIYEVTDMGVNVIINNLHKGLVYKNEIFKPVKKGDRLKGYIKFVREDNKIDVSFEKQGYGNIAPESVRILEELKKNNGFLPLTDKTDPEEIMEMLHMSKKTYKKAVGYLYKNQMVELKDDGIHLVEHNVE